MREKFHYKNAFCRLFQTFCAFQQHTYVQPYQKRIKIP